MVSESETREPLAHRVLAAIAIAVLLWLRLRDGTGNIVDDAYMTLRHARNLALGHGLVYVAGVPTLGTTTPLFALLHGGVGALIGDANRVLWSALIGNALADVAAFLLLARWIGEASRSRAVGLAAAACYAFAPRSVEYASGCMEAPLYTFLILATLRETTRGRARVAGLAAGLAAVCRPDGGLAGAAALAWFAALGVREKSARRTIEYAATAALVALPWLVYAFALYPHGPLPQSVLAKAHRPWTVEPGHAASVETLQVAAAGPGRFVWIVGGFYTSVFRERLVALGAFVQLVVCALGAGKLDERGRREGTLLLGFGAAYFLLYAAGNPLMLGWYQVPLEAVLAALSVPGIATLLERIEKRPPGKSLLATFGVAVLVALQLAAAAGLRDHWTSYTLRERWDKKRERDYLACAARIRAVAPPDAVVQGSESGALGWGWPGPFLDTVGLQTAGCERYYPLVPAPRFANMAVPAALVLDMKPDYFVTLEVFVRETCLEDAGFRDAYELDPDLSDLSDTIYDSRGLLVFRRRARSKKPN
jgi:hypothetical protein